MLPSSLVEDRTAVRESLDKVELFMVSKEGDVDCDKEPIIGASETDLLRLRNYVGE